MGAPKGNQFWKIRSKHGRDKLFSTPEILWEAAVEYFEWCEENPFKEEKLFHAQGVITKDTVSKMRAFTQDGLTLYLGCSDSYFRAFKSTATERNNEDFVTVINHIERIIYNQKFTGAAADLLNPNIIAMELGLKSRHDHTSKDDKIQIPLLNNDPLNGSNDNGSKED